MKEIALCSFYSVAKLVLVVLAGVWLGRRGILDKAGRQSLSRLIMTLFLPCLLVDSLSRNANLDNLCKWGAMALAAPVFCAAGFLLGHLCARLLKVPRSQHRYIAVSNSFGNSSFLPMPLLATICAVAPAALLGEPGADQRSFAYISIYLTVHSPLIWLFAYPYMTGVPLRELGWRRLLNPPLFGSLLGILIGTVPWLNRLMVPSDAPLHIVIDACRMTSPAVFPCALIVLGANLAEKLPSGEQLPLRSYGALALGRLVLMPVFGMLYTTLVFWLGWMPHDPVFLLVMMIEASVPTATNLVLIAQVLHKGEVLMSRLLLASYCLCIVTLTLEIIFFLYAIQHWFF